MPTETAVSGSATVLPLTPVSAENTVGQFLGEMSTVMEIKPSGRIIIEVAGICQATCPFCAQNSGKSRRKEKPAAYMPVDTFRETISRLSKSEAVKDKKIDRVYLYNWGEPFLSPFMNEYLEILREHGLYAVISSNFQKVQPIREENFSVINEVLFSLSGMTEVTYGRIHGDFRKVLSNFEAFNSDLKKYSPQTKVFMSWHRYRFNEHEFWEAYRYSRRHGVGFIPSVAFMNDLGELIQASTDRLPEHRKEEAERDIYLDHMVESITSYKEDGPDYDCPAWDDVVVDERGRLLICCGTDAQSAVGDIHETPYGEMRENKINAPLCKACKKTGVAEWAHNNHHDHNQLPWPSGGGLDALRLTLSRNFLKYKSDIRHVLNKSKFGEPILDIYRNGSKLKSRFS